MRWARMRSALVGGSFVEGVVVMIGGPLEAVSARLARSDLQPKLHLYRLAHMLAAAYLTTSLVVLAVGARYLLACRFPGGRPHDDAYGGQNAGVGRAPATPCWRPAWSQYACIPTDQGCRMEAHWDGSKPGALILFAWPDEEARPIATRSRFQKGSC